MNDALEQALDPAQFARVWKRVVPAEGSCPVEAARPLADCPSGDAAGESGVYLRRRVEEELCRWRTCQGLASFGRSPGVERLSCQAYHRAKRLAAALFLTSGGWYFPARRMRPRRWSGLRTGLWELYRSSQRTEQRDRQAAEVASDPMLRELLLALAEESRTEQRMICQMLER